MLHLVRGSERTSAHGTLHCSISEKIYCVRKGTHQDQHAPSYAAVLMLPHAIADMACMVPSVGRLATAAFLRDLSNNESQAISPDPT